MSLEIDLSDSSIETIILTSERFSPMVIHRPWQEAVQKWKDEGMERHKFPYSHGVKDSLRLTYRILENSPSGDFHFVDRLPEDYTYSHEQTHAFWIEDCMDPPIYIVQGESWESCYEDFVDFASEHLGIRIEERDLPNYLDETGKRNLLRFTKGGEERAWETLKRIQDEWGNLNLPCEKFPSLETIPQNYWEMFSTNCPMDSNGNNVDTESINSSPVHIHLIKFKDG